MPLRIVHVSDIHFHKSDVGWDENEDQRHELIEDVRALVIDEGEVQALLVGGDIAFSGEADEYVTAANWLDELRDACGSLEKAAVFTVPGNHDVNVGVVSDSHVAQLFRDVLRMCDVTAIDDTLRRRVSAADGCGAQLFEPLASYNEFAAQYFCDTTPEEPHWADPASFVVDGWPVRLTGLNSVINSDLKDAKAESHNGRHRLVLGSQQCKFPRKDEPVHIAMAHHPPAWIRDWEVVRPYMRRAHLWLFGHEHEYHSLQEVDLGSVQLSAGAVGPERGEEGEQWPYIPAYSVITLAKHDQDTLKITVQPRYWSLEETRFVAHPVGTEDFFVARRPKLGPGEVDPADTDPADPSPGEGAEPGQEAETSGSDVPDSLVDPAPTDDTDEDEADTASNASPLAEPPGADPDGSLEHRVGALPRRELAIAFMSRSMTERLAIGIRLGVISEAERDAADPRLYREILMRIRDGDLVHKLDEELRRG